ncbi:MAG: hypothetical protein ACI841_001459 [Planctomycetota bacterium]|jgi:hypothetical protein
MATLKREAQPIVDETLGGIAIHSALLSRQAIAKLNRVRRE